MTHTIIDLMLKEKEQTSILLYKQLNETIYKKIRRLFKKQNLDYYSALDIVKDIKEQYFILKDTLTKSKWLP